MSETISEMSETELCDALQLAAIDGTDATALVQEYVDRFDVAPSVPGQLVISRTIVCDVKPFQRGGS